MRFDILTLFPQMIDAVLNESIIGRAQKNDLIQLNVLNIREFSTDKHKRVDDYPYGGGSGMIMQAEPIYCAYKSIVDRLEYIPKVVYMSPSGRTLTQEIAKDYAKQQHIIVLCGHYEGVDQRLIDEIVTDEISIGDYILTGGEIPAMVLVDCISRLIPGVLGNEHCFEDESFSHGLLEYPQYTRPPVWNGHSVPEIMLSGHHANIQKYLRKQALLKTLERRPELLEKLELSEGEIEVTK